MMKRKTLLITAALCAVLLASACATPRHAVCQGSWYTSPEVKKHEYKRVAILGFEDQPLFQQSLTIAFLNRGTDVVEREKIIDIVREQQLIDEKFADLSDKEKAVALGRVLDVDALVLGGVMHSWYQALNSQQMRAYERLRLSFEQSASQNPLPRSHVFGEFGASYRIIDAATGETICVGNRIFSVHAKAKRNNLNKLSQLELIRALCNEIVEDAQQTESGTRDLALRF